MNTLITPTEKRVVLAIAAICLAVAFWVQHLIQLRAHDIIAH